MSDSSAHTNKPPPSAETVLDITALSEKTTWPSRIHTPPPLVALFSITVFSGDRDARAVVQRETSAVFSYIALNKLLPISAFAPSIEMPPPSMPDVFEMIVFSDIAAWPLST